MSEHSELFSDLGQEELFEREMRGYNRRRVDEFVARNRSQVRDLEYRLSQTLDDNEQLTLELAAVRQEAADKPAHEEISERVGQILQLAEEEAEAHRSRAQDEITRLREAAAQDIDMLRSNAKQDTDRARAEAQEQAERMLSAAQEQAEHSVATARAEAEKIRGASQAEAERVVAEADKHADTTVASAKAQAKQQLDEATARATAIHDGAERRLNLLTSRHTETIRRLTEIRDVVATLVAGEASRGSLEDEVNKAVAGVLGHQPAGRQPHQAGPADGRHSAGTVAAAPGQRAGSAPAVAAQSGQAQGLQGARSRAEQEAATAAGRRGDAARGPGNGAPAGRPPGAGPTGRSGNGGQSADSSRPAGEGIRRSPSGPVRPDTGPPDSPGSGTRIIPG